MLHPNYLSRREQFFNSLANEEVAIIFAPPLKARSNDVNYLFRQDNNLWYLTGFPECGAIGVFYKRNQQQYYWLFCQAKDPVMEVWEGRRFGQARALVDFSPDRVFKLEEFAHGLHCLEHQEVANTSALVDYESIRQDLYGIHANTAKANLEDVWLRNTKAHLIDHGPILAKMRACKDSLELSSLQEAVDISVLAHKQAMQATKPGSYEFQIAAILEYQFASAGGYTAYSPIVAGGDNACVLHYNTNREPLHDGKLLLIDAGCEYGQYAADITRTFPINGKFSSRQAAVYEVVYQAQQAAIRSVKPGLPWMSLEETVISVLVDGLLDLGIMQGSKESIIANKAYTSFYPHSFGHFLGLDVHDASEYPISKHELLLSPGMVLTIEPGIYIQPNTISDWQGIGIRIEDDIVVTDNGCKVLSSNLASELNEVEYICNH